MVEGVVVVVVVPGVTVKVTGSVTVTDPVLDPASVNTCVVVGCPPLPVQGVGAPQLLYVRVVSDGLYVVVGIVVVPAKVVVVSAWRCTRNDE